MSRKSSSLLSSASQAEKLLHRDISAITKSPEILKGRVKTLHPNVHAGILSTNSESDEKDLAEQSIDKVDFVVCNLYPCK